MRVPRAGFVHRGGCADLEALRQAPAVPGETFAIPLKHRLGHVGLPSAAAGLVKMAQRRAEQDRCVFGGDSIAHFIFCRGEIPTLL